jgi:putative transposase
MEEIKKSWNSRPFQDSFPYLIASEINFTNFCASTDKMVLIALGVQEDGYAKVLGYQLTKISNKKDSYLRFMSTLYSRGIRTPLIWTGPDGCEFSEAVMDIYRRSDLQHCVKQKINSILRQIGSLDQDLFMYGLSHVFHQKELGFFLKEMNRFRSQWQDKYPDVTDALEEHMTFLMSFFKYPSLIHPYIKSSALLHILTRQIATKLKTDPSSILDVDSWLTPLCRERNLALGKHPMPVFPKVRVDVSALYIDKYQYPSLRFSSGITR